MRSFTSGTQTLLLKLSLQVIERHHKRIERTGTAGCVEILGGTIQWIYDSGDDPARYLMAVNRDLAKVTRAFAASSGRPGSLIFSQNQCRAGHGDVELRMLQLCRESRAERMSRKAAMFPQRCGRLRD